jgi:hypothetical protein
MTDIVEQLRREGVEFHEQLEAAAEIEALREHVNALRLVATSHEPEALRLQAEIERLRSDGEVLADKWMATHTKLVTEYDKLRAEIGRLTLENWQLKGALGYEVPGNIPCGYFKCGLCEAKTIEVIATRAEIERLKRIIGYLEDHADIPIAIRLEARALGPKP